jgi:hypothetical protein
VVDFELSSAVVGDMTWNPQSLRWEGNEACLRDFEPTVTSSVRPALIAHYTGSSMTGSGLTSPRTSTPTATIRIVGDMKFDPERMCWVSNLAPEDDEPDPFEGMADDEDEEGGATITRASGRKLVSVGLGTSVTSAASGLSGHSGMSGMSTGSGWSSRLASESSAGGSMGSMGIGGWNEDEDTAKIVISKELWAECREAEDRHKREMKGWATKAPSGASEIRERERREEKRLWEVRNLATRS